MTKYDNKTPTAHPGCPLMNRSSFATGDIETVLIYNTKIVTDVGFGRDPGMRGFSPRFRHLIRHEKVGHLDVVRTEIS